MIAVLIPVVTLGSDGYVLPPSFVDPGIARGLVFQIPLSLAVLLLTHRLAGLGNVGLQLRGAGTSVMLSVPMLAIGFADGTLWQPRAAPSLVAALLLAVAVGFTEELYGRGLLVSLLGGRRHAQLAVIGSSILFAYLHMPIYVQRHGLRDALIRCTASAAFSATLAIIRLRSGSLVGPILFHSINDAQFLVNDLPPSSESAPMSLQPILAGLMTTTIYWLGCRRTISDSITTEPTHTVQGAGTRTTPPDKVSSRGG